MTPAKEIIEAINNLDFSNYPHDQILAELRKIGPSGLVMNTLPPGYQLIRVRPNRNGERFTNVKQLSYKAADLNEKYQRASVPNETMFYGCVMDDGPPELGRKTAIYETIPGLRDNNADFEEKVTFSRWKVTEEIKLATIVFDEELHSNSPLHKHIYESYRNFLNSYPEDVRSRVLEINSYLSKQFSNSEPSDKRDYLYMVSALYAKMVSEHPRFDGVKYPSVRTIQTDISGTNVAINPDVADERLVCIAVGESNIIKKEGRGALVLPGQSFVLRDGQTDFEFNP